MQPSRQSNINTVGCYGIKGLTDAEPIEHRNQRLMPVAKFDSDRPGEMGPFITGAVAGVAPLAGYGLGQVDVVTPAPLFLKNLFRYVARVLLSAIDFGAD